MMSRTRPLSTEISEKAKSSTTLKEEDGVVSKQSFELLVQWMYLGQVNFGDMDPGDQVTAAIEFSRMADLCGVTGMEDLMAEHVRTTILASSPPYSYEFDSNTYLIESDHITSAACLPDGHPMRNVLAAATVRGFLRKDEHKFLKVAKEVPRFSSDLLGAVKGALKTYVPGDYKSTIVDPFSKEKFYQVA